ncbi:GlxA family transcriptional regulator [Burkholderia gladioli]|uniref:GlxA family transcriptional regulator n=1 Tax=Burkholderia gladioli TaxID=28095 RepID=UPI00163FFE44|nr:helix-turn-helix domain-containing protein [Burkholderia gladioli]
MRIAIIALDGMFDTGLSVTLDAFSAANGLSARLLGGTPRFEVSLVGMRRRVRSKHGLLVPVQPASAAPKPDWAIVPAPAMALPEDLIRLLGRPDMVDAMAQLRAWNDKGTRVAASCIGTFVLAEAGFLDGREATTSWSLAPVFRQRYPEVKLDESRMLVPNEIGVTAGAALGHLDLALWLIRSASPELATLVSRYLLADIRSSQAAYIIPNHLAQADPLIQRFEQWSRANLKAGFSLQGAAKALATSTRSLQRRCQEVLGKSPLAYFQDLRVEHAQSLIRGGSLDLEAIAAEVGYGDGATLRTLLRQRLGRGVRELRADLL